MMNETNVQKLSKGLKVLVTAAFGCNLLVLLLVPGLAAIRNEGGWLVLWGVADGAELPWLAAFLAVCWQALFRWWRDGYLALLTVFLWACGACTAVILWQARRVLDTIIAGDPFQNVNAKSMKRAGVCFFVVSAASLVRLVLQLGRYEAGGSSVSPYNALFVPVFAMGGLLCLVMAALFRQAADLQEDSDLTI